MSPTWTQDLIKLVSTHVSVSRAEPPDTDGGRVSCDRCSHHGLCLLEIRAHLQIRSLMARQCLAEFLGVLCSWCEGAHLNPAFSLAMCMVGRLPWAKLPIYCFVQLLSAFCASGATYVLYYDALQHYTGGNLTVTGPKETASIFATYPSPYLSLNNGFLDQVLGTWMLIVGLLAILDRQNKGVPAGLEPVVVGLLILTIGLSMGVNCGSPLNPARDLGPRLFTYFAGWGPDVFSAGNGWWWVPVVAPMVGATLGTATYQLLVALHHPEDSSQLKTSDLVTLTQLECKL
eukprot:XP_017446884.1 PREDICTED: LOW QUALITY PROTEIN: aquaporin-10 isoform X1 [Rattus norvegicus]